jgi:hypothetical protein
MSEKKKEEETEVMVDVTHDSFMRNVSIHVHMDRPMRPEEFVAELADVVAEYQEEPEKLFITATIDDPQ